jgi:hypothetical protein
MRRSTLLVLSTAVAAASTVSGLVIGGPASAATGLGLTGVSPSAKAPGLTTPHTLSPELSQVVSAQGSMPLENPRDGIGYYGYDSVNNTPPLLPVGTTGEAHKTEPDKNTYLVLDGQTGPDAGYDYGTHFLFQGHESGAPGYVTRINLDADGPHRVTLLATHDATGNLPAFDGSTYDPFTGKLLMTAENGCSDSAGVWQGDPSYAANATGSSFQNYSWLFGRAGYEGVQTASDGSIWLVEDVGGKTVGTKDKLPNSFVYRLVPKDRSDLSKGGTLQALQASNASGPISYDPANPSTQGMADLHSYGTTLTTKWVTVHDSVPGGASFCAGDLAKASGATPFKRPENGVFRPGTGFGEFYFTETGDTDATSDANADGNRYGGFGGVFRLTQDGPSAATGTLTLAYKGDLAHTGLDNLTFLSSDELAVVEDAGDTLHSQRNALDSGYLIDVTQARPVPLRFLAEGRDPSATLDSALGSTGNDGDNEVTGIHASDGDPTVNGLLGAKEPQPFSHGWRVFWTAQHGDNVTFEILLRTAVARYLPGHGPGGTQG